MKTLILTLLISIGSFAQTYVSVGVDLKNAIIGSEPTNNNPAFDGIFRFGMIGSIPGHDTKIECSVGYESFKRIRFDRYIVAVGVNLFPFKKVVIVPSWEGSIIGRWGSEWQGISSHLALLGGSLGIRYEITDNINIEFLTAVLDRVDLNTKHGGSNIIISNSITLIYKL
jgi:hypothetical protein